MATAQDIVTRAYRALVAIDINEQPSPNEMQVGLDTLTAMIAAWAAKRLNVTDRRFSGVLSAGSPNVTMSNSFYLAPGLNVSGDGIPPGTRVESVDQRGGSIVMTANAATGGVFNLSFSLLPLETRHEQGVTALLALQLAPQLGIDNIPAIVAKNAVDGMSAIRGQFMRQSYSTFDLPRDEHLAISDKPDG